MIVKGTATTDGAKIPASLTDFVEVILLENLPQGFWDTVKDGGGDIRVYTEYNNQNDPSTFRTWEVIAGNTNNLFSRRRI